MKPLKNFTQNHKTPPLQSPSTIDVTDILEVISQNNFPNQKQIDLLQILNYALHKKHYPQDICGILDKKIQLLQQHSPLCPTCPKSPTTNLQLSTQKGFKVNFIRVINTLFELSFFTDKNGNNITKKEVFKTFGNAVNQNLSAFQNDLSTTKAAANSDMRSTLAIFEQMYAKQQEINKK